MKTLRTMMVIGLAMALGVAGGAVLASDDPNVIHACASAGTGVLRKVEAPAECRANETVVDWNIQGPPGPEGPAGPPGASLNPQRIAMLRWYEARQAPAFPAGSGASDMAFDGSHIWVANFNSGDVSKLRLDGTKVGDFAAGSGPFGLAFDGSRLLSVGSGKAGGGSAAPGDAVTVRSGDRPCPDLFTTAASPPSRR